MDRIASTEVIKIKARIAAIRASMAVMNEEFLKGRRELHDLHQNLAKLTGCRAVEVEGVARDAVEASGDHSPEAEVGRWRDMLLPLMGYVASVIVTGGDGCATAVFRLKEEQAHIGRFAVSEMLNNNDCRLFDLVLNGDFPVVYAYPIMDVPSEASGYTSFCIRTPPESTIGADLHHGMLNLFRLLRP